MQEAVNALRFHHQWLLNVITFEPTGFNNSILKNLNEKGYTPKQENSVIL